MLTGVVTLTSGASACLDTVPGNDNEDEKERDEIRRLLQVAPDGSGISPASIGLPYLLGETKMQGQSGRPTSPRE